MGTPFLSILLPTHNRRDSLEWALRSLAAQDGIAFEVLICGDGCTDGTAPLAADWERRDPRFRWFDLPKGPGFGYENRNTVLREARGELIGFMAHDDLAFSDHFARLAAAFDDPSIHLAACRPLWIDDAGRIVPTPNDLECALGLDRLVGGRHMIPASCYMHRRQAFEEVGWWDAALAKAADLDLWRRIALHHGPPSVRYLTTPGLLHFRALWRKADDPDPQHHEAWRRLLETPGGFPEALTVPVPDGDLPQAAVGTRLLGNEGRRWQQEVRSAAEHAVESWAMVLGWLAEEQMRRMQELARENDRLAARLGAEQARAEKWKAKAEERGERLLASAARRRWWRPWK